MSKEELKQLKEEVEALNEKLAELSDEEVEQVSGGEHILVLNCNNKHRKNYNCLQ